MPFKKVYRPFPGDLVRVKRKKGYYHYGIATDHFHIIHYSDFGTDSVLDPTKTRIIETELDDFLRGDKCEKMNPFDSPFTKEEIIDRARSYLGVYKFQGKTYNVVTNNCEHFARFIYYGEANSEQVEKAAKTAVAVAGIVASVAGVVAASIAENKRKKKEEEPLQIEEKK